MDGNEISVAVADLSEVEACADPSYSTLHDTVKDTNPPYSTLDDAVKDDNPSYSTLDDAVEDDGPSYSTLDDAMKDSEHEYVGLYDDIKNASFSSGGISTPEMIHNHAQDGVSPSGGYTAKEENKEVLKMDASWNHQQDQDNMEERYVNTVADQLYAVVDKKRKNDKDAMTAVEVDQLYAHVNKKEDPDSTISQGGMMATMGENSNEECEDSTEESGALYSVVNKPAPPQVPPQSHLLMEDDHAHPQLPPQSDLLMEDESTPPQLDPLMEDKTQLSSKTDLLMDDPEAQVSYDVAL